jgi:DNA topoisomerase-6 subunit B
MLIKLLKESGSRSVSGALQADFSRVTTKVAQEICDTAGVKHSLSPKRLSTVEIEKLYRAVPKVKVMAPPTNCIVPIGEELIQRGLAREIKADFYVSVTRPPMVYRGNPFRLEVGLAYGGNLREGDLDEHQHLQMKAADKEEGSIRLLRIANRVPLQYQQSACAIFKAVSDTNWKQYGLPQPRGALPQGPMVLLVHMASVWVPFTSESKEAVAHYPEIIKEVKMALRDVGRRLASYLRRKQNARLEARRRSIFHLYAGELARSLAHLSGKNIDRLQKALIEMANERSSGVELLDQAGISAGEDALPLINEGALPAEDLLEQGAGDEPIDAALPDEGSRGARKRSVRTRGQKKQAKSGRSKAPARKPARQKPKRGRS